MFLIRLAFVFMLAINVHSDPPGFISLDCGATSNYNDSRTGLEWVPDILFTNMGQTKAIKYPRLLSWLTTLRYFPERFVNKYCYLLPVYEGRTYLLRTSYYYGNYDGRNSPPVFDQIIDGTKWGLVNTSTLYSTGSYSFYEAVIKSTGKTLSLCLGRNEQTVGDPFISAIELRLLAPSIYNATDFENYGMSLVARSNFGYSGNDIKRYPTDGYDRLWLPFKDSNQNISTTNISVPGLWNLPPNAVFETALVTNKVESMEIQWPQAQSLENSTYYISLYFLDIDHAVPPRPRIFNVSFNGITFYSDLNISDYAAWAVFSTDWTMQGLTKLSLDPVSGSSAGPLINAGEMFQLFTLGGRTLARDVRALNKVKESLTNVPLDWEGDPCLPVGYSWTGITCSQGSRIRVTVLNLTSAGLSGSLSPSIANLTALSHIWLGNNNISGSIPDLKSLKLLSSLHLEGNRLSGTIPKSLANLKYLSQLYLQHNDLSGTVPEGILNNPGLELWLYPGNALLKTLPASTRSPTPSSERSIPLGSERETQPTSAASPAPSPSPSLSPSPEQSNKARGRKRSWSHMVWTLGLVLGHLFFLFPSL